MRGEPPGRPLVSVVAPMYNEEDNVWPFVDAVTRVLDQAGVVYELLLVDDGSRDQTWERIGQASAQRPAVRGLSLSRNFGHQSALFAGLHHARGLNVVTMDGDLQHPPELIPRLLQAWQQGHEVVTTVREDGPGTGLLKRLGSRAFYLVFSRLTGVPLSGGTSDFRLLDAEVVRQVLEMRDQDLFLRGMVSWLGFRTCAVPYQSAPRHSGRTKYTWRRMLRFATSALTGFSMAPLKVGVWLGFLTSGLAFVEIIYIFAQYARGNTVPGWASVMTVMSLMFGVLFILLGTVGIYLGKVYEILKGRQRFVVGRHVGFPEATRIQTRDTSRPLALAADEAP